MKIALFVLLLAASGYGLYAWAFARAERVYAQLPRLHVGMRPAEVRALLGAPDTTYVWTGPPVAVVWHYDMGPIAPDDVRVFWMQDTVAAVTYNQ
jgi:hypothetical protein